MIINTRPVQYEAAFSAAFSGLGHDIVVSPALRAEALPTALPDAAAFDTLVLTSQTALAHFPTNEIWRTKQVFAVGEATAAMARGVGYEKVTSTGENAVDLLQTLKVAGFAKALYPSAETVVADLELALPERVQRVAVYRTVPTTVLSEEALQRLRREERTYVPLFSARSASAFAEAVSAAGLDSRARHITVVAISKAVDLRPWRKPLIAPRATTASIVQTLKAVLPATALAA